MQARAVIFDFNGTVSNDEAILAEIFRGLFAELGKPLTPQEYFERLAGLSDEEIVRTWLGADYPGVDAVVEERVQRYREAVSDGSTVSPEARAAVLHAARRVPTALVSGAARAEIEPVLAAAGLADAFAAVVPADDVERGKPDPEGYERALELLAGDLEPGDVVAFEDTEVGVAAAKGAGLRCVAVRGTVAPERLAAADEVVDRIDAALVARLVGS